MLVHVCRAKELGATRLLAEVCAETASLATARWPAGDHWRRQGAQDFTLEVLGNWAAFDESDTDDQSWDLEQTRTHDLANELATIDESAGDSWVDANHDKAGNMISGPKGT